MNDHLLSPLPATILIVDDTPANLRLLAGLLGNAGYQVRPARDGRMALSVAQSNPPDLILLDIMMPEMDGYEVCRLLKADERTREIPVIFISALDDVHDKVKSFTLGAVDYVAKPFQAEEVMARVRSHITLYKLQRDLREQVAELDAFAHTVAHDLKNPLALVIGLIDFVLLQYADDVPQEMVNYLKKVQNTGYRGVNIIDELLLLASVRKQDVRVSSLDMEQIIAKAQDRLMLMMGDYQATVQLPEQWPTAVGYAPWVEEVWVNYMSNALKYGGQPPLLALGTAVQPDGMVRYWVRDNGAGLSPEKQAVLFTEFVRLNEVRVEGFGLGLSIVRRIMDKLNGRVGVISAEGQGSEFYFELPAGNEERG
ncbi:MAG TPA: hybrid sensor histidine kinase/response regulator [Chloroflexota bacterium]|nr:hybrid sensor histidine kinase/response regulator [Chloroflexota bacterium]